MITITDASPPLTEESLALADAEIFLDLAVHGVLIADLNRRIRYANPSFLKMLGYTSADQEQLRVSDFDALLNEDQIAEATARLWDRQVHALETKFRGKNQILFDVELTARLVRLDQQDLIYISVRDISRRKAAEERLVKQNLELEQLYQSQQEMLHYKEVVEAITGLGALEVNIETLESRPVGGALRLAFQGTPINALKLALQPADFHRVIALLRQEGNDLPAVEARTYLDPSHTEVAWFKFATGPMFEKQGQRFRLLTRLDVTEYKRMQLALEAANTQLEQLATLDALTGVYNRRAFETKFAEYAALARREPMEISMLIIDIDHFKQINDRFGHLVGDMVLKGVAEVLQSSLRRQTDIVARVGGDEFFVLLPSTKPEHARALAEELLRAVADFDFLPAPDDGPALEVGISIGISTSADAEVDRLYEEADRSLYQAKERGRGQACFG